MKRSFFIFLFALGSRFGFAQQNLPKYMSHDTSLYQYPPLMILKMTGKDIKLKESQIDQINPNDIDSLTILKDTNLVKSYGTQARFGVIIVKMKKYIAIGDSGADSYGLNNLSINNKTLSSYNLPVYIDSVYVNRPENINRTRLRIRSASINTETATGIKFIDILTNKTDGIQIKGNEKIKNGDVLIMIR